MLYHPSPIKVVITLYNNAHKLERCLRSVANQSENFDAIVVDDASDDNTKEVFDGFAKEDCRFFYVRNPERVGPLASRLIGAEEIVEDQDDLFVMIDGDDELNDENVLADVAKKYAEGYYYIYGEAQIVVTAPDYTRNAEVIGTEYPQDIIQNRTFRDYDHWFAAGFPRCFPYWLLKKVPEDRLKIDGRWVTAATDRALFTPMMELVAPRIGFIPRILYRYHRESERFDDHPKHVTWDEAVAQEAGFRWTHPILEPVVEAIDASS